MNLSDQVASLLHASRSLEDLGQGLSRVIDGGKPRAFIFFGADERCLVTVPWSDAEAAARVREALERAGWRQEPREALRDAFGALGVPSGKLGEDLRWAFLGTEEKPIGAIACVPEEPGAGPDDPREKTRNFFFHLAGELAQWIVRSSRDEVKERSELLEALNQIGRVMLVRPDRKRILPSLLKIVLDVARAEVGSVLLLQDGRFVSEAEWGLPGELLGAIRFPPDGEGILERIRRTLETVIVDDVSGPSVEVPPEFRVKVSCLVAIPLLSGNRLVGILNVASGEEGRELLLSTVASISTMAVLIATLLENYRLEESMAVGGGEPKRAAAAEAPDLLRRVLSNLEEGVLISDGAGAIVASNPAAEAMLGLGQGRGGRFPERGNFPERSVITLRPFFQWLRSRWRGAVRRTELEYRLALDPPIRFSVTVSPLAEGAGGGHVTVIRDRSERAAAGGIAGAARIAQEMEKPLAAIRIAFPLLISGGEAKRSSRERLLRRGIERLSLLAEDLRDLALQEEARDGSREEGAPPAAAGLLWTPAEALEEAVAEAREELEERRIAWKGPDGSSRFTIAGDPARLGRALRRVARALIRASADGGWLRARAEADGESWRLILEALVGPGAAELASFLKAEPDAGPAAGRAAAVEETFPGSLGLAVAKRTIEALGGRITFELDEAQEGRLVVEAPLAAAAPGSKSGTASEAASHSPARSAREGIDAPVR